MSAKINDKICMKISSKMRNRELRIIKERLKELCLKADKAEMLFYFANCGFHFCWLPLQDFHQRWPESLFLTPTPLLFQNFSIRVHIRQFFKFENPTPVQTPSTIIDPTVIYPCFYLINDHTDSWYCRNWKVTPNPGPVFHKFLTPGPGPKEKRKILPESTPALSIRCHL